MVNEIQYTTIQRVLDDLLEHPMLQNLTLEQVVRYTVRFIGLHGFPQLYSNKIDNVEIHDFRGAMPCDLISIIQVKDLKSGECLRAMTDTYNPGLVPHEKPKHRCKDLTNNMMPAPYGMDRTNDCQKPFLTEQSFKTQGRIIYTSFPEGVIQISYLAIPIDEDGYPMLLDNENYLAALEAYIKKQVFTIKFDCGEIIAGVLQNIQQEYAWAAATLDAEMHIPSVSEMESITRMINTLIDEHRHFDNGFINMGNREYIRNHN